MKFKTIAIIGFSGAGKTALAKDISAFNSETYSRVITDTTREIREGEISGIDYNYPTMDEFKEKIKNKNLVEYAKFNGNYYGMPLAAFSNNKINLVVCEPSGILSLYNHPKINLMHIVRVDREYSLILNSVEDEARVRQITSRRMNREEEKELEKIPLVIKNQIITLENNSSDIRFTSLNFNKIFNMENVVNLYDYNIKEFIQENIKELRTSYNRSRNQTIKVLLDLVINEGRGLLELVDEAIINKDIPFMSKANSFLDNLEVVKTTFKNRRTASNLLSRTDNIAVHSKPKMMKDYHFIKNAFEELNGKPNLAEHKKLAFMFLEKNITILDSMHEKVDKKTFRHVERTLHELVNYIQVLRKTIYNPIAIDSSFIVDAAHIQFTKYKKNNFIVTIDETKKNLLDNDILFKLFLNNGEKIILHFLKDNDKFVASYNNLPIFAFPIISEKLDLIKTDATLLYDKIKENKSLLKYLPYTLQSKSFFAKLLKSETIDDSYNHSLYIKDLTVRTFVSEQIEQNKNNYSQNLDAHR